VDPISTQVFPRVSPVNGEKLPGVAAGNAEDIDRAVAVARRTFESSDWRRRKPRERKKILKQVAQAWLDRKDELAALQTVDMGKPISDPIWEVEYSAEVLEWFAEAVDHLYDEVAPLGWGAQATISREPVGVVGAITPWNYPILMPTVKLAPALASGNAMVLKPADQTPLVALRLAEIATEAGLPAGVLNVVPGTGEAAGDALARHMDVDAIGFTGSTAVGRMILRSAAESNLKKVQLELGGKSPSVVLADAADLATVASRTAASIFGNVGQMCDATSRLVVHESLVDEVVAHMREAATEWQAGDPFDPDTPVGAMVDERQMNRVLDCIAVGQEEGAIVAVGGRRVREESGGYFIEPTVLRGVTNDMRVAREEIFGPVLSVISFSIVARDR
jgi:acyl-CoA reductase-like NAD-dependent aldehyde dehydrogenase